MRMLFKAERHDLVMVSKLIQNISGQGRRRHPPGVWVQLEEQRGTHKKKIDIFKNLETIILFGLREAQ